MKQKLAEEQLNVQNEENKTLSGQYKMKLLRNVPGGVDSPAVKKYSEIMRSYALQNSFKQFIEAFHTFRKQ